MKVALTKEISSEISQEKINLMTSISIVLESFFENREYGDGVWKILFGIICVAPVYEWFHKVRAPRLQKVNKLLIPNHETIISKNVLSMDIKLDFERVRAGTNAETIEIVKLAILSNLNKIEKYKSKFDYTKFKRDMESVLCDFDYDKSKETMKRLLMRDKE